MYQRARPHLTFTKENDMYIRYDFNCWALKNCQTYFDIYITEVLSAKAATL